MGKSMFHYVSLCFRYASLCFTMFHWYDLVSLDEYLLDTRYLNIVQRSLVDHLNSSDFP